MEHARRTCARLGMLLLGASVLVACAHSGGSRTDTVAGETTTSLDVVRTGFPTSTLAPTATSSAATSSTTAAITTTTSARDVCAAPAPEVVPADVSSACDREAGWRQFAWISPYSADGLVLVERLDAGSWVQVEYGTFCGGVGAADVASLINVGVPAVLAERWGMDTPSCDEAAGRSPAPRAAAS